MKQLSSFEQRVRAFYINWAKNQLANGDPIQDLADFVRSEVGRSQDERLDDSKALVLYFRDDRDREDFIAAVRAELVTRGRDRDAMRAVGLP